MGRKFLAILAFLLALALVLIGLCAPVRFGSVPKAMLSTAEPYGQSLEERTAIFLRREQTGPAAIFIDAAKTIHKPTEQLQQEWTQLVEQHPDYLWSGGPNAFFDAYWAMLPSPPANQPTTFAALLASSQNRNQLLSFLQRSPDPVVRALLGTRTLTGWERFFPADTSGGAALDSAVLTTALLAQSGAFNNQTLEELEDLPGRAARGDAQALAVLERLYLSVLTSSAHFNWLSLQTWVEASPTLSALIRIAPHLRRSENIPLLYACAVLSEDAGKVSHYLDSFPEEGMHDLTLALNSGSAALTLLLTGPSSITLESSWSRYLPSWPESGKIWTYEHPDLARAIISVCWLTAGWLLAVAGKSFFMGQTRVHERLLIELAQDFTMAVCLLLILLVVSDPALLNQSVTEPGKFFLEFELQPQVANLPEQAMSLSSIDQVTLLILLLYFVVQLVIYVGCLVRLGRIKRAPVPATTRLKLIENEENLFEMGLYVGLSGTVISLLMLALGVVQASLVAAYSSTLFGIIFVALLKIVHVRPTRQKLILESERTNL